MINIQRTPPITQLKLLTALRDHGLDHELDEYTIRLRLPAIEMELEQQKHMLSRRSDSSSDIAEKTWKPHADQKGTSASIVGIDKSKNPAR